MKHISILRHLQQISTAPVHVLSRCMRTLKHTGTYMVHPKLGMTLYLCYLWRWIVARLFDYVCSLKLWS